MKNKTLLAAFKIGFDYENSDFESQEEFEQIVFDFLNENVERLEQIEDECEVTGDSRGQNVNYGDFTSSGEIIQWRDWWYEPRQKIYHSNFLYINDDGQPLQMKLWCWSKNEELTEIEN